jgi:hypothetical protein
VHRWHEKTHFLHNKSGGEIAEEPGDDHENVNKQALKLLKKQKKTSFFIISRGAIPIALLLFTVA